MVLPEKNLSSPPPQKKRKALGLALSVKKNSGLARAKKKSSPLLKSKTVGLALLARGKLEAQFASKIALQEVSVT